MQMATDLHDIVAPKLVAALLVILSAEAEDLATDSLAAKVQQLTAPAGQAQAEDAAQLQARAALVVALLLRSQAMQQPQLRLLAAEHLLPWLARATCVHLYDQVRAEPRPGWHFAVLARA
jgi:hypothetical protein